MLNKNQCLIGLNVELIDASKLIQMQSLVKIKFVKNYPNKSLLRGCKGVKRACIVVIIFKGAGIPHKNGVMRVTTPRPLL